MVKTFFIIREIQMRTTVKFYFTLSNFYLILKGGQKLKKPVGAMGARCTVTTLFILTKTSETQMSISRKMSYRVVERWQKGKLYSSEELCSPRIKTGVKAASHIRQPVHEYRQSRYAFRIQQSQESGSHLWEACNEGKEPTDGAAIKPRTSCGPTAEYLDSSPSSAPNCSFLRTHTLGSNSVTAPTAATHVGDTNEAPNLRLPGASLWRAKQQIGDFCPWVCFCF